jgi:hypothetical protein
MWEDPFWLEYCGRETSNAVFSGSEKFDATLSVIVDAANSDVNAPIQDFYRFMKPRKPPSNFIESNIPSRHHRRDEKMHTMSKGLSQ